MASRENLLWYNKPAADWNEALPLGNGRMGMMVYGGIDTERLQLNEETLWSGNPQDADNPSCLLALPRIRELLFSGHRAEAEELSRKYLVCQGPGSAGEEYGSYQTAGELLIHDLSDTLKIQTGYRRVLNLDSGIAETKFAKNRRRCLVSDEYDVCAVEICGVEMALRIQFSREGVEPLYLGDTITIQEHFPGKGALSWAELIHVESDNSVLADGDSLLVTGNRVVIFISIATDYRQKVSSESSLENAEDPLSLCTCRINLAKETGFDAILENHIAYMDIAMSSCDLILEGDPSFALLPTDERIAGCQKQAAETGNILRSTAEKTSPSSDTGLNELYFRFAKYLLISSSKGQLPANLQGIWSKDIYTPWRGDYHLNINLQMNYWPAELMGLQDYLDPLFRYIAFIAKHGSRTARIMYGCSGWVAHVITNPWGFTAPGEDPAWGSFLCSGAWCCRHLMEHYRFTGDADFLRCYYPIIRDSARFFLDFLIADPNSGYLVVAPTNSPENRYIDPVSQKSLAIAAGTSMDSSILRELFSDTHEAASVLNMDETLRDELESAASRLPPLTIGRNGQIMEWQEDYTESEPGHRHFSPLFGLYPGSEISEDRTDLRVAARTTIDRRIKHGGGHTGWSRTWMINLFARLKNGEEVQFHLDKLYALHTQNNLFDTHPPFQIDGNFGGAAGIAEALIQSHSGIIELLPALPSKWESGSFRKLRARGGFSVSAAWKDHSVYECTVESACGGRLQMRINGRAYDMDTIRGQICTIL